MKPHRVSFSSLGFAVNSRTSERGHKVKLFEKSDRLGGTWLIAVFDRNMKMIYMNEHAKLFYHHVFGAADIKGKDVKACHQEVHIKNIMALMEAFDEGKPLSFFHAEPPMIEGGRGEYVRKYE